MSVHANASVHLIKMDQCQCTGPFGWTDQPEKPLSLFPPKTDSRLPQCKKFTQPKARKKIARHAHLALLSFGGRSAIFSISSALSAQDLDPE